MGWPRGEELAEELERRLGPAMSALGIVFLLVVLGSTLAEPGSAAANVLEVAGWLLWGVFALDFAVRMAVAPDRWRFLRRYWWQLAFLVLPFLRFLRVLQLARHARSVGRLARGGRIISSAVRSTRSAGQVLGGRIGWLAASTVVVVLTASQLLYAFDRFDDYGEALYRTAYATITGEPMGFTRPDGLVRGMELLLAMYSVAIFAVLAASIGSYFVVREPRAEAAAGVMDAPAARPEPVHDDMRGSAT